MNAWAHRSSAQRVVHCLKHIPDPTASLSKPSEAPWLLLIVGLVCPACRCDIYRSLILYKCYAVLLRYCIRISVVGS